MLDIQFRPWRSESETSFDGPLSSRAEWHAFVLGVAAGLRGTVSDRVATNDDVRAERHYFAAGFVLGWTARQRVDK